LRVGEAGLSLFSPPIGSRLMKKILLYVGLPLGVILLGAYLFLQFFLGAMVKSGVNQRAPHLTQTKVELRTANLSPLTGRGTLWGFAVGNPKGWSDRDALSIGIIHVELAPFSIFGDHIVIHEIIIDSPLFNYEKSILSSNIGDIVKNLKDASGKKESAEEGQNGGLKLEVHRLVVRNGKVTVGFGPAATTMNVPEVELTDVGVKEGGITPGQLGLAIMHSVSPSVIAVATHAVIHIVPTLGNAAGTTVKKTGEMIEGLFGDKDKEKENEKK
jgi:hypothetical protein